MGAMDWAAGTTRRAAALAVLAFSLTLSGCGASADEPTPTESTESSAGTSDQETSEVDGTQMSALILTPLPAAMPEPLKLTVDSLDLSNVRETCAKKPKGWCEGIKSAAMIKYGEKMLSDDGQTARFDIWEYRSSVSAQRAFDFWNKDLEAKAKGHYAVPKGRFGEDAIAVSNAEDGQLGERAMLIREGEYVGIVRTKTELDATDEGSKGPTALYGLTKMLAERMHQAQQGQAPEASAEHLSLD